MWIFLLLWNLKWLFLLDLVYLADCGNFVTKNLRKVSYFYNVTEKSELIFASKADIFSELYLYNDTFKIAEIVIGNTYDPKRVSIVINCGYHDYLHTSDLINPTEYSWLWLRWTGTQIEFGTGKTPGVDLLHSRSFSKVIKYIGFAKYAGNKECYWIVDQTNEYINESVFKRRKGRRITDSDTLEVYQVKSAMRCAVLCLGLNGCYGFNLSLKVNGIASCELIQKDLPYPSCFDPKIVDWDGEIDSTWTHYYL